ncbi:succinate dehydrogenase, hydrophobic membrane anchor protein [Roseomonas sp. HF4]|uniref:succinate dehydrogenase, hydrophobic membrane anchor protein n=1 Tax=Roseomonas sp. HF4 TaxID=2562313 RepID=UPI001484F3BA|nr:succinate dehydrogenase, hydrophobic membrane anchor protein [Roseomonas sp. HF4]
MAAPTIRTLRSPLGRVRGLGAGKGGTHHWWMQRVTSIALLPLTLWLVFSLATMPDSTWQEATAWIGRPLNAVLLLAFLAAAFHHTAAGLQVVIEDYMRGEMARLATLLAVKGLCVLLWLAATLAVLRIAV